MKNLTLFLAFILLSINGFAQEWVSLGGKSPSNPETVLLSQSDDEIIVRLALDGFSINKVLTPRGMASIVSVPKMASMLEEGAPDLPLVAIPVVIGDTDEMEVKVVDAQFEEFQDVEIAPSKGNFSHEIDPETVPYSYGEAYSKDEFWPAKRAELDAPYILRDLRGQNILAYPFAYNPVTKVLRVYKEMTFSIHKISDKGENPKLARKAACRISPETETMYARRFVNYRERSAKYPFIPDEGETIAPRLRNGISVKNLGFSYEENSCTQ